MSDCKDRLYFNTNISRYYISGESGCQQEEAGRQRPGAAECWNERHRARLASLRAGDRAHRDIERGKLERWRRARRR